MSRFAVEKMANKFTVNELQALVTYYGSPDMENLPKGKLGSQTMEIIDSDAARSEESHGIACNGSHKNNYSPVPQVRLPRRFCLTEREGDGAYAIFHFV